VPLALRAMGCLITKTQIDYLIKKYDPERSGKVNEDDYMKMIAEMKNNTDSLDQVRASFSAFDKSGTGLLSCAEMDHVLTRIGDTMNVEEMTNFLNMFEGAGHSGTVTMGDLINLFQSQTGDNTFS